jgi:signal transduction histidine kinase
MSHELRTPLNAILLYSELLAEDAEAREDGRSLSDLLKIRASGHHLLSMLNTVLDLSKIEAGKMELAVEMISPEILMAEVRDTLLPQARKGGNDLVVELGTGIHWFPTDATKLRQVLLNLGSNACKFTHHGRVTLGLEGQPEGTLFIVRDTGIGMNAEQAKRVFLPYEQAEATTSTRYGGTGLGLALSTKYVELMGGTISLQSELGQGTAVTVQIPWEPPAAG